ncbi:MAG: GtrA family protein [Thermomicrobiales bacterium]
MATLMNSLLAYISFLRYRYRYLGVFTLIGLLSIVLELLVLQAMRHWSINWPLKALLAFLLGLLFSFGCNAWLNFQVSRRYLLSTFVRFCGVSFLSFALNMVAVAIFRELFIEGYNTARLGSSALLFLLAYTLHRRFTFDQARNYGVAVYATVTEDVDSIYTRLGRNCDHVHIDLVDHTMNPHATPVDLDKVRHAQRLWPGLPFAVHLMSLTPRRWLDQLWDLGDWFLFHLAARDDLFDLILQCRTRDKKVGIVWHVSDSLAALLPYLPHVDFVMVLGIAQPGQSGQVLLDKAVQAADLLDRLRPRYGFQVMFDGGVGPGTIGRIRARYVVAASAVLRAADPVRASHSLRTGARYERRSA